VEWINLAQGGDQWHVVNTVMYCEIPRKADNHERLCPMNEHYNKDH
jgi:hypothetical protein